MKIGQKLIDVELDAVGKAAEHYTGIKLRIKSLKQALEESEKALIKELKESGRFSINIGGVTFVVDHIDKERIKVMK